MPSLKWGLPSNLFNEATAATIRTVNKFVYFTLVLHKRYSDAIFWKLLGSHGLWKLGKSSHLNSSHCPENPEVSIGMHRLWKLILDIVNNFNFQTCSIVIQCTYQFSLSVLCSRSLARDRHLRSSYSHERCRVVCIKCKCECILYCK